MIKPRVSVGAVVCLVSVFSADPGRSQPTVFRAGTEFRVNTYTPSPQRLSSVAIDGDGDFVVVWTDETREGSYGVFGRRVSAAGIAQGGEFQVNLTTASYQTYATVDMSAAGDFVVAWQGYAQDGSGYGIFARRFSAAGLAQAFEFQVNSSTAYNQKLPALGMDADGDFVVSWRGFDADGYGVLARRFNAAGVPQASEFLVHGSAANNQERPAIGMNAAGDFVVVWDTADASGLGVFARRFDASGVAQATEFQVNAYVTGNQLFAAADLADDGNFVIAWASVQDGNSLGVFARRFNAAGVAQAVEFQVNTYTVGAQEYPEVAVAEDSFVIVWSSYPNQDGSSYAAFARRFDAAGVALTGEIQVSAFTTSSQNHPVVAATERGDFVVAWETYHETGSQADIFAQRFEALAVLDIDGNGDTEPLTDGLLVLRFLFGFSGATLVAGAIDAVGCTRCDATVIAEYLQTLI